MTRILIMLLLGVIFCAQLSSQSNSHKPKDLIEIAKKQRSIKKVDFFSINDGRDNILPEEVQNYEILNVDHNQIVEVLNGRISELLEMRIPSSSRSDISVELVEVDIFSTDSYITIQPENKTVKVNHGKHFRGIIKGNTRSLVAISIYENEVMGFISEAGRPNLVLGKLKDSEEHILYEDSDLKGKLGFACDTPESDLDYSISDLNKNDDSRALSDCVKIYIEVDHDIYLDKGSNITSVSNFTTGLFNQVATMYANEQVNVVLSPLVIWTQPSPYNSTSSSGMLNAFLANTGAFDGDLAQLISYKASGGIAYVNGLCSSNPDYSKSFSSINSTYQNVPTYSWSVMVMTHEFGHLFGSQHTHACAWNGNNTAIDGCYTTEGGCGDPGIPSGGGTVMSYCHLTNTGINLNLGFGSQPGNLIRNRVANASCTQACEDGGSTCFDGIQNGNETGVDCGGICPDCPSVCNDTEATLTIVTDNYPGETTWTLSNASGAVVYSGGPYSSQGQAVTIDFCLVEGCYDFTINDTYGDGICCTYGQGSYDISIAGQSVVAGGQFNSTEVLNFCTGSDSTPTCNDGVQNGDETEVDCGGSNCEPCASCNDGFQNNGETDVDCGGPNCPACETCEDGIQNGDETGVDCGGSDCEPCDEGDDNIVFAHYFESSWDGWQDGGSDCYRYSGARSYEGNRSIRIRDNSGLPSSMTSSSYDLSAYSGVEVTFYFFPNSMEFGEDFWLRYFDGNSWQTVATFASGSSFQNNSFYTATVPILGSQYNMASNSKFRFQCDASANADRIYIDAVSVTGLGGNNQISREVKIQKLNSVASIDQSNDIEEVLAPNPASNIINIRINLDYRQHLKIEVLDILGRLKLSVGYDTQEGNNIIPLNIVDLNTGTYFIKITDSEGDQVVERFVKVK